MKRRKVLCFFFLNYKCCAGSQSRISINTWNLQSPSLGLLNINDWKSEVIHAIFSHLFLYLYLNFSKWKLNGPFYVLVISYMKVTVTWDFLCINCFFLCSIKDALYWTDSNSAFYYGYYLMIISGSILSICCVLLYLIF